MKSFNNVLKYSDNCSNIYLGFSHQLPVLGKSYYCSILTFPSTKNQDFYLNDITISIMTNIIELNDKLTMIVFGPDLYIINHSPNDEPVFFFSKMKSWFSLKGITHGACLNNQYSSELILSNVKYNPFFSKLNVDMLNHEIIMLELKENELVFVLVA